MPEQSTADAIAAYLTARFNRRFGPDGLDRRTDLFATGILDSFDLMEVFQHLESTYGVAFDADDLTSPLVATVAGLATLVDQRR